MPADAREAIQRSMVARSIEHEREAIRGMFKPRSLSSNKARNAERAILNAVMKTAVDRLFDLGYSGKTPSRMKPHACGPAYLELSPFSGKVAGQMTMPFEMRVATVDSDGCLMLSADALQHKVTVAYDLDTGVARVIGAVVKARTNDWLKCLPSHSYAVSVDQPAADVSFMGLEVPTSNSDLASLVMEALDESERRDTARNERAEAEREARRKKFGKSSAK